MGWQREPNDAARKKANAVMNRIGAALVKQSKASHNDDKENKSAKGKNILSLLVQANTAEAEAERITDDDVMARAYKLIFILVYLLDMFSEIPTFLIAGHETTRYTRLSLMHSAAEIDKLR